MAEDLRDRRSKKSEAGFTLMEIIIVVVIIGMLAALVGPRVMRSMMESREKIAKIQISQIEGAIQQFGFDMGRVPTTAEGLQALMQNPTGSNSWRGPYLTKKLPDDPWNKPYSYRSSGQNDDDFDICSAGPDGIEGTDDDVCSN